MTTFIAKQSMLHFPKNGKSTIGGLEIAESKGKENTWREVNPILIRLFLNS